jgi:hypothetical protein
MTISAALDDLINALEEQSDTLYSFLDRETGEVFLMSDESLSLGEAEPENRRSALEEILRPWCEENGITLRHGKATQP